MNAPPSNRKHREKTIVGFLLWNLCVFGFWIWCREGSEVHIRLIVDENHHSLFCNGQLVDWFEPGLGQTLPSGRVGLGLSKDSRPPLIVGQQEFYNFRVTDTETGEVLWSGEGNPAEWDWTMIKGEFQGAPGNRLISDRFSAGVVGDPEWRNYVIDVDCANPTEVYILFRTIDAENYGRAQLRFWRELVVGFTYIQHGEQSFNRIKNIAEPFWQGIRSLTLRFIKVYSVSVLILGSFLLIFIVTSCILRILRSLRKEGAE